MNRSLIYLTGSLFLLYFAESMFTIFQPIYLSRLGATPIQTGFILGASWAVIVLVHIPGGLIADRIGSRSLLLIAACIEILAAGIMGLAFNLPVFVLGLLLYSLAYISISPLNSYITAARGNLSAKRVLTTIPAIASLGSVLGALLGGWVGDNFGLRTVYLVSIGLLILSTILLSSIEPQPVQSRTPTSPLKGLLGNQPYLGFLVLGFFVLFASNLPQPLTSKFLQEFRGLSLSEIGILGAFDGAGRTIINLTMGFLNVRLGFALSQLCIAAFCLLIWRGTGIEWYCIAYFLLGGFRAIRSLFLAQIHPLVPYSQMGVAYGIAETVSGIATVLASVISGLIYQQNASLIYTFAFIATISGAFLSLVFAPRAIHKEHQHPLQLQESNPLPKLVE